MTRAHVHLVQDFLRENALDALVCSLARQCPVINGLLARGGQVRRGRGAWAGNRRPRPGRRARIGGTGLGG